MGDLQMGTLKQLCKPRPSVFDRSRRDVVLDLTDLVEGRIDPAGFFRENHPTEGMKRLLREAFRRFDGQAGRRAAASSSSPRPWAAVRPTA